MRGMGRRERDRERTEVDSQRRGGELFFFVVVWHYLHTIEIAANKRVRIFIFVRETRRVKKGYYLHTNEIATN